MSIPQAKLEFWAKNRFNVCLAGRHGVGKTGQVKALFNELYGELGVDWLYFSASTMDPWVDFIGVPKEKTAEDGVTYLGLVRPEVFARDQVKAIFLDEYNRAPKKIRNAVMELIQFGSINGHKFENLEVVWTAINPPDEDAGLNYDVDEVDPAQLDRFHVYVEVPYGVSRKYFVGKYGSEDGAVAVEWWNALPSETKDLVSPRRLDYAMDCYSKGGDIRDILDKRCNVSELLFTLSQGSMTKNLKELYKKQDTEETVNKLAQENFFKVALPIIMKDDDYCKYFIPCIPPEKFSKIIASMTKAKMEQFLKLFTNSETVQLWVADIVKSGGTTPSKERALKKWVIINASKDSGIELTNVEREGKTLADQLWKAIATGVRDNTHQRVEAVEQVYAFVKDVEEVKKTNELLPATIKKMYLILLHFVGRSRKATFKRHQKQWLETFKALNGVLSYDKHGHDHVKYTVGFEAHGYDKMLSYGYDLTVCFDEKGT